ncbi:hypothetical protein HNV12_02830 [Methanococcoides sp. SA1]|nr:hypothetical protein [Methanococcoides sp. SA1]
MTPSSKKLQPRAQVGMEFLIIAGAALFFASIFLLSVQERQEDKTYQHQNIQLQEIALTVQNEINLAFESSDGYSREFEIPQTSGLLDYEITIDSGIIYIKTTNDKHALTVPVPEITGDINKTQNKIKKISGVIYLNQ